MHSYNEEMDAKELSFLAQKDKKQRTGFFRVFRILMVLCFVMPYIFAWYRVTEDAPNAFSYTRFFIIAGNLLFVSGVSTYFTYRFYFRKLKKDLHYKTKTIEIIHITRKTHVPHSNTYYFFIDSPTKLSIEVSMTDYRFYNEGDEVNIEYSTYSREYFGYF